MPGRGCLARKLARRQERDKLLMEEGLLPAAKMPRMAYMMEDGSLPEGVQAERAWVEVPPLSSLSMEDRQKAIQLCCALWEATQEYGDGKVTVSQLGSHFKVAAIKKEPCFNNMRLVDLIKRHVEIFELIPETGNVTGGWVVKLMPGAADHLPDRTYARDVAAASQVDQGLPPRIEEPVGMDQMLQALRIEVLHACHKRGMQAMLHDLGQEPKILKHKNGPGLHSRKLLELIKIFPQNFSVEDKGNGNFSIELISLDVDDISMIPEFMARSSQEPAGEGKGKAQGKGGKGKGGKGKAMAMMMKGMGMDPMAAMGAPSGKGGKSAAMKGMMMKGMMAAWMGKAGGKGWGDDSWGGMDGSWGGMDGSW
mmetsp:Transcript_67472/g.135479  ORF Transcript_67472/g.135479 Transcript_67472/m.135479 type:complete len:366 (-) Transcript_67472:62-1159(-)